MPNENTTQSPAVSIVQDGVSKNRITRINNLHAELDRYAQSAIMVGNGTDYSINNNTMADAYILMLEKVRSYCKAVQK